MSKDEDNYSDAKKELLEAVKELHTSRSRASENGGVPPEPPFCSFCGRGTNQVSKLIAGNNAYICNQCVVFAMEVLGEEGGSGE